MSTVIALTFSQYMRAYKRYALDFWETMTPMDYGMILIGVFVAGYLMMKSTGR